MKTFSPMKQARAAGVVLSMLVLLYSGCDKGLVPDPSGFSGVIHLRNWPPADSVDLVVQELRLVAFKNPPIDTTGLLIEFLKGNVVIYPPVGTPNFPKRDSTGRLRDSIHYTILLQGVTVDQPAQYKYVALAWRYGPNSFVDWRPAGIYTIQPGSFVPATITIPKHQFLSNIDIECDFRNPPPKPWR